MFFRYVMPVLIQLTVMFTDVILIGITCLLFLEFGIGGVLIGIALMYFPTRTTGGLFYAWRPSSMKLFWQGWQTINYKVKEI